MSFLLRYMVVCYDILFIVAFYLCMSNSEKQSIFEQIEIANNML